MNARIFIVFFKDTVSPAHRNCRLQKESPIKKGISKLIPFKNDIMYATEKPAQILPDTLSKHSVCYLLKACDIGANYIVTFRMVFLGGTVNAVENVNHDLL